MKYLSIALVIISFIIVVLGIFTSKSAPQQSVIVGLGCFLGIMARIAQASSHHAEEGEIR